MKKLILTCFMFYVLCSGIKLYAEDRIVAIVNREIITQSEVDNFARFLRMQLAGQYKGKELEERFNEMLPDILTRLVEDRLILQEAKREKVKIDESRVKAKLAQMKEGYPSDKAFTEDTLAHGLTLGDIEGKIRDQLMMHEIVDAKIRDKIKIYPHEVTEFYEKYKEEFNVPIQRSIIAIVTDNEAKATEALAELKKGADFKDTAKLLNLEINDLGPVKPGEFTKELEQAVSLLQVGEVSDVVKSGEKFYIFKLQEITPEKERTLDEVKQQIYNYLLEEKMQEKVATWLDELKLKSYIEIKREKS